MRECRVPFKRKCQRTRREAKQEKARQSKGTPAKAWVGKGNAEKAPESFARPSSKVHSHKQQTQPQPQATATATQKQQKITRTPQK